MDTPVSAEPTVNSARTRVLAGQWIIFLSGCVFILSLFLSWARASFLVMKGYHFMQMGTSQSSGLPEPYAVSGVAAVVCILFCIPFLKVREGKTERSNALAQLIVACIGLLAFLFLPFEMQTWIPHGRLMTGGWLAAAAAIGLLGGSIFSWINARK